MPPKNIVTKEQIIDAALEQTRKGGIDSVTARNIARRLGVSTHPIFSYFDSIEALKTEVFRAARLVYKEYILRGFEEKIPFLGIGHQYMRFAAEERELYKLIFLTPGYSGKGGSGETFDYSFGLIKDAVMRIYNMDEKKAECYYRILWLASSGLATMTVTGSSDLSDERQSAIMTQVSLAVCKAIKEIPGFEDGDFDREKLFTELVSL